ncbi:hypothetical protein [Spirochaeta cellobiosiphila]|uniref:hypothetical protein n=1 Tax=Spirochaeta cellobiosiphila TaxID=504483 RepID=UPI00041241D3|nr:hypothetical protein [Spirochaeta cellobiosiphila]
MQKKYSLNWNRDHLVDIENDIFHMPFKGDDIILGYIFGGNESPNPDKFVFSGDFNVVGNIDYITNDLWIPVLSKRMIDLLTSLGSFKYELIPCEIFDFTIPHEEVFEDKSKWLYKPNIELNKDYYALRLLDDYVEMDYEKSEYDILIKDPLRIGSIENLVLRSSKGGLPPLFRIKEKLSQILVPESVKEELEASGLKGLVFESEII